MSALTTSKTLLLLGTLSAAPLTLAYSLPLPQKASAAIANRYLAFDDVARDAPLSPRKASMKRKWKHGFISEQIRSENAKLRREPDLMFIPDN